MRSTPEQLVKEYRARGWWGDQRIFDAVHSSAASRCA